MFMQGTLTKKAPSMRRRMCVHTDVTLPVVRLRPLTDEDRDPFLEGELANYADEQVRDSGWPRAEAFDRARLELGPVLERELSEAAGRGHRLWSAVDPAGEPVGWLWVTPGCEEPGRVAFLYQITVIDGRRRQGFGRAMLRALEELLVREGFQELCLNVMASNEPALRMYAKAGYEPVDRDARRCRLSKRLGPPGRGGPSRVGGRLRD
jgi:ribosomal protein S18 acetylase RimI-like enzyme